MKCVAIDLRGQRFGRWSVLRRTSNDRQGAARWLCVCDCGVFKLVTGFVLRRGDTKSCGCLARELSAIRVAEVVPAYKHGFAHNGAKSTEWVAWTGIIDRCLNPNNTAWKNYGGRGITVCEEWQHDFMAFYNHIGPKPTSEWYSVDRIDNERGYEPGNVRWATRTEQNRNRRKPQRRAS